VVHDKEAAEQAEKKTSSDEEDEKEDNKTSSSQNHPLKMWLSQATTETQQSIWNFDSYKGEGRWDNGDEMLGWLVFDWCCLVLAMVKMGCCSLFACRVAGFVCVAKVWFNAKNLGSGSCLVFVAWLIQLIMNWSVHCSCFASCLSGGVWHTSLRHATEAKRRRGLVRSLPAENTKDKLVGDASWNK
jgi:hypothetical protein